MLLFKVIFHFFSIIKLILYKIIYGKHFVIGKKITFRKGFFILIDSKAKVIIGDRCFFNNDCSINAMGSIIIGNDVIVGENVKIYDHNHRFNKHLKIKEQGYSVGKVIIGNNCWIGSNVTLLKGTTIGDNCVIGAGLTLSGKISPDTILKQQPNYYEEKINYNN